MSHSVKVTAAPVIALNIDVDSIIKGVEDGKYNNKPSFLSDKTHPSTEATLLSTSSIISKSSNNQDDVYCYMTVTGEKIDIVSTGVGPFRGKEGGECFYCRREYTGKGLGYCIDADYRPTKPIFYVEDECICKPECLLAYIDYIHIPPHTKDRIERLTESMLRALYGHDAVFVKAKDFRLLIKNRGTETYEQWSKNHVAYKEIKGVTIRPIKREYIIN